ncbi:hypothetical protein D3C78_919960 [compost metagenome]
MVEVEHLLLFGDFEDDPLQREVAAPRGFQGGADAGFRAVDRIGHEVDRQQGRHRQLGAPFHRLDPALLVEVVAVLGVELLQQAACRAAVDTAHQRLMGEDLSPGQVDDRLEGHAQRLGKTWAALAGAAGGQAVGHGWMTPKVDGGTKAGFVRAAILYPGACLVLR